MIPKQNVVVRVHRSVAVEERCLNTHTHTSEPCRWCSRSGSSLSLLDKCCTAWSPLLAHTTAHSDYQRRAFSRDNPPHDPIRHPSPFCFYSLLGKSTTQNNGCYTFKRAGRPSLVTSAFPCLSLYGNRPPRPHKAI